MTWILSKVVSNPLVLMWLVLGAFGFGATTGGGAAWWIQGLRITAAEQEFTDYKQQQKQLIQEAKDAADKQRTDAAEEYARLRRDLGIAIQAGDSYRRCVAAGKCGRLLVAPELPVPGRAGDNVPATGRTDDASTNAVPAAGQDAAVVTDCASTTLQINSLQSDIEKQRGYKR